MNLFKKKSHSKPTVNGKKTNIELGKYGEKLAVNYLKKMHYKILTTNFKSKNGEIDIIAKDGEFIVFIEVKYRSSKLYGMPSEAVEKHKQQKIKMVAMKYLAGNPLESDFIRFDVVQIVGNEIELIKSAFN